MAISDAEESVNEPRKVKLKTRKHSFGFKVRGQVSQGGPRWLIDGKEYKNLQTVSEVLPESAANYGGVLPGDKILSINGIEVEGIEHERFKELMEESGDEVELIVITPNDAKMLDIPSSVTIHRSDGSTLNINDPDVLKSQNIDQAIQNEEKKAKAVDTQNHSTIIEIDSTEASDAEEELPNQEAIDDNNDTGSDLVDEKNESFEVQEEGEHESKDELSVSLELGDLPEESDVAAEIENEERSSSNMEDDARSMESPTVIVNIDDTAETSFIDSSKEDSPVNEGTSGSICTSEQDTMNIEETECSRKQNKGRKGMRILPKRPKVRPFSPDTFNDLSPYYSRIKIRPFEIEQKPTRSWKYNQRPTSLSVLHPSEALRLESEDSRKEFTAWSSNFSRRRTTSNDAMVDDQTQRIRQDVYNISKLIDWRNARITHRRISQKRMSGLSEQFRSTRKNVKGVNG